MKILNIGSLILFCATMSCSKHPKSSNVDSKISKFTGKWELDSNLPPEFEIQTTDGVGIYKLPSFIQVSEAKEGVSSDGEFNVHISGLTTAMTFNLIPKGNDFFGDAGVHRILFKLLSDGHFIMEVSMITDYTSGFNELKHVAIYVKSEEKLKSH